MIIFNSIEEIGNIEPVAVALGNFDGIHRGHRELIETAVREAGRRGIRSAVFTFSEHPRNVMAGKTVVRNIIYEDEKNELLETAGVDYLFSLPFDEKMRTQTPESFVRELLMDRFHVDTAICGFNFTYGHKASGTAETLQEAGRHYGFNVVVIPSVLVGGEVVSSTLIRQCIMEGDIHKASELLGRSYTLRGTVIHGEKMGRRIGFPTCNITIDESMVTPANGVYVTGCWVDGVRHCSITNVGNKPTVGQFEKNIETNILNFDEDVYGKTICVEFMEQIRTEKKFSGLEELKKQIREDVRTASAFHRENNENILRCEAT